MSAVHEQVFCMTCTFPILPKFLLLTVHICTEVTELSDMVRKPADLLTLLTNPDLFYRIRFSANTYQREVMTFGPKLGLRSTLCAEWEVNPNL